MRRVLAIVSVALLCGCYEFASERPLYPQSAGACPIAGLAYSEGRVDVGGAISYAPAFTVASVGAYCVQRNADGESLTKGLFAPLGEGWYIVQTPQGGGLTFYTLARIEADRFTTYAPRCEDDFTPAALEAAGVRHRKASPEDDDTHCFIDNAHALERLMRAWTQLGRAPLTQGRLAPSTPSDDNPAFPSG